MKIKITAFFLVIGLYVVMAYGLMQMEKLGDQVDRIQNKAQAVVLSHE